MNFDRSLAFVLAREGGESDDKIDPGGHTKYGISAKAFPTLDISTLTREQAVQIYRTTYWNEPKLNQLPEPVAFLLFDMAVNQGVGAAIRTAQKAGGVFVDGVIGPLTVSAVNVQFARDPVAFLTAISVERARRYLSINTDAEERFEFGWVSRLLACLAEAVAMVKF